MIKIELTQEHIDKAVNTDPVVVPLISKCCPLWQAVSEALGRTDIEVGLTSVVPIWKDSNEAASNTGANRAIYYFRPQVESITCLAREYWHTIKPQTIEMFERKEEG